MDKKILNDINTGKYEKIDLNPGELQITKEPKLYWTVLGSCISVIFYNKRLKASAICHAQLAEEKHREYTCVDFCPHPCYRDAPDSNRFKFVTCSVKYMYDTFRNMGIQNNEITVKLFGGAKVIKSPSMEKTIGDENVETAVKMLENYGLKITSQHTGGENGRTLYFYSDTGEVYLKKHRN
jgi:chemotaxis protein CheD